MVEESKESETTESSDAEKRLELQAALDAVLSAKDRATELVLTIEAIAGEVRVNSDGVKKAKAATEAATAEAEKQLGSARPVLDEIKQQGEAARTLVGELQTIRGAERTASQHLIEETTAQATTLLATIQENETSAIEAGKQAEILRQRIEQLATESATRSDHIEAGRVHSDEIKIKLDASLTKAQEHATSAETQDQAIRARAEVIATLQGAIQEKKTGIDATAEAINSLRSDAEKHTATTQRLAETAETLENNIKNLEQRLVEQQSEAEGFLKKIESLLLGATNAGLAHAFDARGQTFKAPEKFWQRVFVGTLILLLVLAGFETWGHLADAPKYEDLLKMFLQRLPFLVPLVWLAIYASRQASLAKRMEEEYAFKATISTSFEGYRRQMAEISKNLPEASPLARLCNETLQVIGKPPGHVYDKHRMDPTPGTAANEVIGPIVEGITKALDAKIPGIKVK